MPADRRPAWTSGAGFFRGIKVQISLGTRTRVALVSVMSIGLALFAVAPASAVGGAPTTPTELFNAYEACSIDSTAPV